MKEIIADTLNVLHRIILLGIGQGQNRLRNQRNTAVSQYQLQIGPGTNGLHGCIFLFEYVLVTVILEGCISIGNKVIAVVDDGIIIGRRVIDVIIANLKISNLAQIGRCIISHRNQIAASLTQKHRTVADLLKLRQDAGHGIDGIVCIHQMILIVVDDTGRFRLEEIGATGKCRRHHCKQG